MLNIPKKLLVGYNARSDTYSGKLAYVVYETPRGKIAKEKSWRGWLDEKMGTDEFPNEPTSGFVLNRKAGETYSWDEWHVRRAKIRVWDPRGFEVEITPENLLYILECCDCLKGKGISGKLLYAWDGADMLLLPEDSVEYKTAMERIEKTGKANLGARDLIAGNAYRLADSWERGGVEDWTYLGKAKWAAYRRS